MHNKADVIRRMTQVSSMTLEVVLSLYATRWCHTISVTVMQLRYGLWTAVHMHDSCVPRLHDIRVLHVTHIIRALCGCCTAYAPSMREDTDTYAVW